MPDYHIYMHSVSSDNANDSPTTPWQLKGDNDGGSGGVSGGGGFSPARAIRTGAMFLSNPDSLIGSVMRSTIGKIGITSLALGVVTNITDKAINMYQSFAAPASGDYKFQIDYANFKQQIHNAFHPFSTMINRQHILLQQKKENLANEQQRLLLGGTFLNSPYGRYL